MKPFAYLQRHRLAVFVIFAAAGILSAVWVLGTMSGPGAGETDRSREHPRGTPFAQVVNLLDEKGLVRSRLLFRVMAYFYNAPSRSRPASTNSPKPCQPGTYYKNRRGEVKAYNIVVPEGFTVRQIAARLAASGLADEKEFVRLARDRDTWPP